MAIRISLTFLFAQPYDEVLACVLRRYSDPSFLQCVSDDLDVVAGHWRGESDDVSGGPLGYRWAGREGAACLEQVRIR